MIVLAVYLVLSFHVNQLRSTEALVCLRAAHRELSFSFSFSFSCLLAQEGAWRAVIL